MKKIMLIYVCLSLIAFKGLACPSINIQLTSGGYNLEGATSVQLFKITAENGDNVVVQTRFANVNSNQIGIQAVGAYKGGISGDLRYSCGPVFQEDICYRIEALNQVNEPSMSIRFISGQSWSNLIINYNQGLFTLTGGNPASYQLNQCRFCEHDLVIGPDLAYSKKLTECDSWIITDQDVVINPSGKVVWDASPQEGYIDLNPGFVTEPSNSFFLAQLLDGCGPKIPGQIPITVNMWLQGYYTAGAMSPVLMNQSIGNDINATDWVNVEIRQANAPFDVVSYSAAKLAINGTATFDMNEEVMGAHYLVVKHRQSIETWSANPLVFPNQTTYDFTTAANSAFGANQVEVEPSVWAIYSGDFNQDGYIDGFDYPAYDLDVQQNISSVYTNTDLNGDGYVDGFDYPIFDANSQNNVSAIVP